ncbi:glycoside hydrolase family 6 protein [Tersicoccus sp. MR15.9]|uniref:glycoside hydrolase family 6 protein n=1 Tax=Tersicoccus mangrovi TaxID=3121635 RepID=UPI002FE50F8E
MVNRIPTRMAVAVTAAALVVATPLTGAAAAPASPAHSSPAHSAPSTRYYVPPAPAGSATQIRSLLVAGDVHDAALVAREVTTPQAVWFTDGTAKQVEKSVRTTMQRAARQRSVPTLVVYDVPGRDCSQYSSGGAGSDAAYRTWIDGFVRGLGTKQQAIVIVEPDGLANLPSDCPAAYPGQDVAALTAGRIADVKYAGTTIASRNRNTKVYLDAGHSGWHSVADATSRLEKAGVGSVRGFSLNVSNYQWTPNLSEYGTWISDCIALHPDAATTTPTDCGDQYYSGGPANNWQGGALDGSKVWSTTATDPTANVAGIDSRYAQELQAAGVKPTTGFVLDTSRNGRGPWTPAATTAYPDPQTWCNPPDRGLGARPAAHPSSAYPLLDAYLWIKTPGQSDGQCNRGIAGSTTDPEWGGITDPAAGAWFPQQALQLAKLAQPALF